MIRTKGKRKQNKAIRGKENDMSKCEQDKIYTSASLTKEMNEERVMEGKESLPEVNPMRGDTSTIARKDKSWKSVPDFFAKLFKKK